MSVSHTARVPSPDRLDGSNTDDQLSGATLLSPSVPNSLPDICPHGFDEVTGPGCATCYARWEAPDAGR